MAWRIERAEAQLVAKAGEAARRRRADGAGFVIPVAGGVAGFAGAGSPFNKVAGLGFGGAPGPAALAEIERAYALRARRCRSNRLADPAIGAVLTGRGYRLTGFDNVLGLVLEGEPERVTPPGVEIRPSGEEEFESWLHTVLHGFAHPDTPGVPWHGEIPREVIAGAARDFAAAGGIRYIALHDGVLAGAVRLRMAKGVALLAGATTAPAYRRGGCRPRWCRPGSPTPQPPAATSRS